MPASAAISRFQIALSWICCLKPVYFYIMAENKKSFLLYIDIYHTVKKLTDEQAGVLFKHILSYVNDENPILNNLLLEIAFEPIKQSLKRDLRSYEAICKRNQHNGLKGGRPKKKPKKPSGLINNPNNPDEPRKADIDIDIDIDKEKEKKNKYAPYVLLLDSEYFKLTEKYGDDIAKKCVEKLNNYKGSTGKKYKSDYLTILNWVVGEVLKDNKLIKNDVFAKYGVK